MKAPYCQTKYICHRRIRDPLDCEIFLDVSKRAVRDENCDKASEILASSIEKKRFQGIVDWSEDDNIKIENKQAGDRTFGLPTGFK